MITMQFHKHFHQLFFLIFMNASKERTFFQCEFDAIVVGDQIEAEGVQYFGAALKQIADFANAVLLKNVAYHFSFLLLRTRKVVC